VHLPSWADGKPCLRPLTPQLFTRNALPFAFDPRPADPTMWLALPAQLWGAEERPDTLDALQERVGYCLTPDTSQLKILLMVGTRRSGKGTIGRVLCRLVGEKNVCAPTLASLGTNFGLQPLLGKTVALISDARISGRTDSSLVAERLLSISGEDA